MNEQNEEYYRQKYLKYKAKYLALQEQSGSGFVSAIGAFLSLNGTYLIFHRFTEFDKINEFMKNYIPNDEKKTVTIDKNTLKKFDDEINKPILGHIFNHSVIVHIYKHLISKNYHIEIAEFNNYFSKKTKLDFNLTEFFKDAKNKKIFKVQDIAEFENKITKNDKELLTIIQNFCMKKLNSYYHDKKLFEYYRRKYGNVNHITNYDYFFGPDNEDVILKVIQSNFTFTPILSHVFIMDEIKKSVLPPAYVQFKVRNVKLNEEEV
jgi:hypothetical protein